MKMKSTYKHPSEVSVQKFGAPTELRSTVTDEQCLPRSYKAIRPALSNLRSLARNDQNLTTEWYSDFIENNYAHVTYDHVIFDAIINSQESEAEYWAECKEQQIALEQHCAIMKFNEIKQKKRAQRKLTKTCSLLKLCANRWILIKNAVCKKIGTIDEKNVTSSHIGSNPNAYTKFVKNQLKKEVRNQRVYVTSLKKKVNFWDRYTCAILCHSYQQHLNRDSPFVTNQMAPPKKDPPKKLTEPVSPMMQLFGAFKEGIQNFTADCFANFQNVSLQDVIIMLEKLKPMTFTLILMNYVTAQSSTEKMAVLYAFLEAYDMFWNFEDNFIKQGCMIVLIDVLDMIISHCWSSVRDLLGAEIPQFVQNQIIQVNEDSCLSKFFSFLGLEYENFSFDENTTKIIGFIGVIIAVITGGKFTGFAEDSFKRILKRVNQFSTTCKSVHNILEYFPKLWDTCMTSLGDALGFSYEGNSIDVKNFISEIMALKKEAHELYIKLTHAPWEIMHNKDLLKKMSNKYDELDKQYIKLMNIEKNMSSSRLVFDELKEVIKTLDEFVHITENSSICKQEPFLVLLSGDPGIGKSCIINGLTAQLSQLIDKSPTSYSRNTTVKHWDDYSHQSYVIYDDFGQKKTDQDHADVLDIKNPNKTVLSMAKISEKGRLFTSVGMICATNSKDPTSSATVKCIGALQRRLEINIEVIDPRFDAFVEKHGRSPGDYAKFEKKEPMWELKDGTQVPYFDSENFSHLIFILKPSYLTPNAPEKKIKFYDLLNIIKNYHDVYLENFKKSLTLPAQTKGIRVNSENVRYLHRDGAFAPSVQIDIVDDSDEEQEEEINCGASVSTTSTEIEDIFESFDLAAYRKSRESKLVTQEIQEKMQVNLKKKVTSGQLPVKEYVEKKFAVKNMPVDNLSEKLIQEHSPKYIINELMDYHNMSKKTATKFYADHYREMHKDTKYWRDGKVDYFLIDDSDEETFIDQIIPSESIIQETKVQLTQFTTPIFVLCGDSGSGKSSAQYLIAKKLNENNTLNVKFLHGKDLVNYVPSNEILIVEDFTFSQAAIQAFVDLTRAAYDGQSPLTAIVGSCNPGDLNRFYISDEMKLIFERRCFFYDFTFNWKQKPMRLFNRKGIKFTTADIQSKKFTYGDCVLIKNRVTDEIITWTGVVNEIISSLKSQFTRTIDLFQTVPYINYQDYQADISLSLGSPLVKIFDTYYSKPDEIVSDFFKGLIQVTKGHINDALSFKSLLASATDVPVYSGDMDQFIIEINNYGFRFPTKKIIEINALDDILILMPQIDSDIIVLMKVIVQSDTPINIPEDINEDTLLEIDIPATPSSSDYTHIEVEKIESDSDIINDKDLKLTPEQETELSEKQCDEYRKLCIEDTKKGICNGIDKTINCPAARINVHTDPKVVHVPLPDEEIDNILKTLKPLPDPPKLSMEGIKSAIFSCQRTFISKASELASNLTLETLFTTFPNLKSITIISVFILKLFLAGMSINALIDAGKARFMKMDPYETFFSQKNKKGWKDGTKKINCNKNLSISRHIYNDLRSVLNKTVNKSAKRATVDDAIQVYFNYYTEKDDIDVDDFDDFYSRFHESNYDKIHEYANYNNQTREEKVIIKNPTLTLLEEPLELQRIFDPFSKENIPKLFMPKKENIIPPSENIDPVIPAGLLDQSMLDPAINDFVTIGLKHQVQMYYDDNFKCFGLMLGHKVGVTVAHYYSDTENMIVEQFLTPRSSKHKITAIKVYPKLDLMFFKVEDKTFPSYSSIEHHFPNKNQNFVQHITNCNAILSIPDRSECVQAMLHSVRIQGDKRVISKYGEKYGVEYVNPVTVMTGSSYRGPVNTQFGDCGSLLMLNTSSTPFRFVGIHNAANESTGFASFIFREMFSGFIQESLQLKEQTVANTNVKRIVCPHHEIEIKEISNQALLGMPVHGEGNLRVNRIQKSSLWTSPLSLPESQNYEPSIMSRSDDRNMSGQDPFYRSVAKWNHPQPEIDEALLNQVVDDIGHWYATTIKHRNYETKILTKTEAINSGKNYNVMPINRKSASGYPWFRYGKKEHFLKVKNSDTCAYYSIDLDKECGRKLNSAIDFIIHTCKTPNLTVAIPFSGWLKDEPLKKKKIYDCNTRSFTGAPFDYTIAYRMYYATIYGAIHEVRDVMPIQVGINPTSLEWHKLAARMLSVSDSGFDMDFSGFDSTVPAIFQRKIVKIYNKIAQLNDPNWKIEDDIVREGLHLALYKPLIICPFENQSLILQAPGGQPSGHPGTADDNSMIHLCYLYYSWLKVMLHIGRQDLMTISAFKINVAAMIYGDDGGYTVHPTVQQYFNFSAVHKVLDKINIKCTPASKGDKILDIIKFSDFEFLKRDFKQIGKFWYGPLKKLSFGKMLGFCLGPSHDWFRDQKRVCIAKPDDLIATADSAMHEAILHGEVFFNEIQNHCFECLNKYGIEWYPPTYKEVVRASGLPLLL